MKVFLILFSLFGMFAQICSADSLKADEQYDQVVNKLWNVGKNLDAGKNVTACYLFGQYQVERRTLIETKIKELNRWYARNISSGIIDTNEKILADFCLGNKDSGGNEVSVDQAKTAVWVALVPYGWE